MHAVVVADVGLAAVGGEGVEEADGVGLVHVGGDLLLLDLLAEVLTEGPSGAQALVRAVAGRGASAQQGVAHEGRGRSLWSRLLLAQQEGEWFDVRSGEPESWQPAATQTLVMAWARQWLAEEWLEWAPRSRHSQVEALARFVPLVGDPKASEPPAALRHHLKTTLPPEVELDIDNNAERCLTRWGLSPGELNEELLADVDRRLGIGDNGRALAPSTAGRYRKVSRTCMRRAVELKKLPADPVATNAPRSQPT